MVLTFQALGGPEHLLSAAFASCLSTLASDMLNERQAPSKHQTIGRGSNLDGHHAADWACTVAGERTLAVMAALPSLPSLALGLLAEHGGHEDKQKGKMYAR
jgi:hypothetical protein